MPAVFQPGDVVVYRKQKSSTRPGPNAQDIKPARFGDTYNYAVDKFWRVLEVLPDTTLLVLTRRGKQHTISADDPALRRAYWWELMLFQSRFPPKKIPD